MKTVNCIILAGGKSSRMNFNKEYMKVNGEYLVYSNIKKLRNTFSEIIVISNNEKHYSKLNVNVYRDLFYRLGPMAGLHSGLVNSTTDYSFLIACDMPNINLKLIEFLIGKIDENYDGLVCLDKNNEVMPMYGIYKNSLKQKLKEDLTKDLRKFKSFILENNFKKINFDEYKYLLEGDVFVNLNTLDELSNYESALTKY